MALFVAMQIVLARYLGWQVSHSLRISLETVPVILAAAWLGPLSGALVGALSDVLGMLLQPSSGVYFPPLTLTPVLLALFAGYLLRLLSKDRKWWALACGIFAGEICSNFLYGSLALHWYYKVILNQDMPFLLLLAARAPAKGVLLGVDLLICCLLHKVLYEKVVRKAVDYEL